MKGQWSSLPFFFTHSQRPEVVFSLGIWTFKESESNSCLTWSETRCLLRPVLPRSGCVARFDEDGPTSDWEGSGSIPTGSTTPSGSSPDRPYWFPPGSGTGDGRRADGSTHTWPLSSRPPCSDPDHPSGVVVGRHSPGETRGETPRRESRSGHTCPWTSNPDLLSELKRGVLTSGTKTSSTTVHSEPPFYAAPLNRGRRGP